MPVRPEMPTEGQLAQIRHRHAAGAKVRRLAARFRLSATCIEAIVRGRPWRHLANEQRTGDLFDGRQR